jgi:hypothetical protein
LKERWQTVPNWSSQFGNNTPTAKAVETDGRRLNPASFSTINQPITMNQTNIYSAAPALGRLGGLAADRAIAVSAYAQPQGLGRLGGLAVDRAIAVSAYAQPKS